MSTEIKTAGMAAEGQQTSAMPVSGSQGEKKMFKGVTVELKTETLIFLKYGGKAVEYYYIYLHGNTYPIKEELKRLGYQWRSGYMKYWLKRCPRTPENANIIRDEINRFLEMGATLMCVLKPEEIEELRDVVEKAVELPFFSKRDM